MRLIKRISVATLLVNLGYVASASAQGAPTDGNTPPSNPPAAASASTTTSVSTTSESSASTGPVAPEATRAEPFAAPPPAPEAPADTDKYPRIGGHIGMALPIATIAKNSTAIGADFVKVGLTPGITVHLDDKWSIDFEFIAFNEMKNTPNATTFVVDPGLLRKFGPVTAGLRVATEVGARTNVGLVPIIVVPVVKVTKRVSYFVEADLPLFLRDDGDAMRPSATFLFQTGFGF